MADLFVSWDEYHQSIETLALQIHQSGWQFNQIVCLARGGLRIGDTLSRIAKLYQVTVAQIVSWNGQTDVLGLGVAVALVIAALNVYLWIVKRGKR